MRSAAATIVVETTLGPSRRAVATGPGTPAMHHTAGSTPAHRRSSTAGRMASRARLGAAPLAGRVSIDPAAESTRARVALKGDIM